MANKRRSYRIAEQVRELLAWELQRVADPRFNLVTVTSVVLSPDLRSGRVYWMVSGGQERQDEVQEAFDSASGLFKGALSRKLKLRCIPDLRFYYDDTQDVSEHVIELLNKVRTEEYEAVDE